MSAATAPEDSSPKIPGREFYYWLWLTVALASLHTLLTIVGFGPWRLELGSVLRLTTGPIAVVVMTMLGLRGYRRGRAATLWLTASVAMWWIADALYGFAEVIARWDVRQISVLGVPYLLSVFMMMIAVMLLPKQRRSRNESLSILAETLIVIVASITAIGIGLP
jgi:hypothetical protein